MPTKDRPAKVRRLLETLREQTAPVGRILIIDGGISVAGVVAEFAGHLPVEHHVCHPPSQIRQRNMGIGLLDARTPLTASLDDDIELDPTAVERMIAFWNRVEPETAAVSFNITNTPPEPNTLLRRLCSVAGPAPGRVLPSGMTTSNCQAVSDARVDWVCGGATVWRSAVLQSRAHTSLPSKWAIAEDVVYSYPLSREFPMYVCAGATVRHEHVFDYAVARPHQFHGFTQTVWLCHFVETNPSLSLSSFVWMVASTSAARFVVGLGTLDRRLLGFAVGQWKALGRIAAARVRGRRARHVIEQLGGSAQ